MIILAVPLSERYEVGRVSREGFRCCGGLAGVQLELFHAKETLETKKN